MVSHQDDRDPSRPPRPSSGAVDLVDGDLSNPVTLPYPSDPLDWFFKGHGLVAGSIVLLVIGVALTIISKSDRVTRS